MICSIIGFEFPLYASSTALTVPMTEYHSSRIFFDNFRLLFPSDHRCMHNYLAAVNSSCNRYSRTITQPKSQGASQAMLYATGLTEEDMQKPQVGIASMWYEGNPVSN
jgi:hypothetical protein